MLPEEKSKNNGFWPKAIHQIKNSRGVWCSRSRITGKWATLVDVTSKNCSKFSNTRLILQRPLADSQNKSDSDNGENKIILCSATDKFVLSQDVCVMCGALGTDQEGCLIACVQCGQCYHPYCMNIKVRYNFYQIISHEHSLNLVMYEYVFRIVFFVLIKFSFPGKQSNSRERLEMCGLYCMRRLWPEG